MFLLFLFIFPDVFPLGALCWGPGWGPPPGPAAPPHPTRPAPQPRQGLGLGGALGGVGRASPDSGQANARLGD